MLCLVRACRSDRRREGRSGDDTNHARGEVDRNRWSVGTPHDAREFEPDNTDNAERHRKHPALLAEQNNEKNAGGEEHDGASDEARVVVCPRPQNHHAKQKKIDHRHGTGDGVATKHPSILATSPLRPVYARWERGVRQREVLQRD